MYTPLPQSSAEFSRLPWAEIEPWYRELADTTLTQDTLNPWLQQWSNLTSLVHETLMINDIEVTRNTADPSREQRKQRFLEDIYTHIQAHDQVVKEKLFASGLEPEGFAIPLRDLKLEAGLFRDVNLPLLSEEKQLCSEYVRIGGAQNITWEGKEVSIHSLGPVLAEPNRERRETAWRARAERQLEDRAARNNLWTKLFTLRKQIAQNAGFDSYREYRWQQLLRCDYTPEDCKTFHSLIERLVVPVSNQLWEQHRQRLGVETLRPWDLIVNSRTTEAPRLVTDVDALLRQCAQTFHEIDPNLGSYFDTMNEKQLFDLDERPNKSPGGYNLPLEVQRVPFVFGRVNSIREIVPLVFHEAGHAFHVFEMKDLPYIYQRKEEYLTAEFAEVASTSMEFIGMMHLSSSGLCTEEEALQIRIQHLQNVLMNYLPSIVRGDAFQHWVYENPDLAVDPANCDAKWEELSKRYLPLVDWDGLQAAHRTQWQNVLHFFELPFYYIEYAFAALGALQIWSNYLRDPKTALQQYRYALSLGATKTVPELYSIAGANFNFTEDNLQPIIQQILQVSQALETQVS